MNDIDYALDQLINFILMSEEYQEYDLQRNKVKQFPELKAQIDEYRRRNFELQNREDFALDKVEQFEREYANFRSNPLVNDFLAAELGFCRLMQDVTLRLTDAVAFE